MRRTVRFWGALAALVFALAAMIPVAGNVTFAQGCEVYSWHAEMPKGIAGYGGLEVRAMSTDGCRTYDYVNYVGRDGGQPAEREDRWQAGECERIGKLDSVNVWKYKWGIDFPESSVQVTCRRL